jgi:CDP-L-myo-inositol myo-inositolphosphotransferase
MRLREENGGGPKPLTQLLGLSLLERSILSCRAAGVHECYVVVGYAQEKVIHLIDELQARHGISITVVRNPNWETGNGSSALAAISHLTGPFLLLMCDHVFDPAILRLLMTAADGSDNCLLAVDRRTDRIFDLADATKVRLDSQSITAIGKELTSFDGVDTGLFLCSPALLSALEKPTGSGKRSLTRAVRHLIEEKKIRAVDVGDRFWLDVDTPESLSHARRVLLANLAKPCEDGFVARWLNRRVSLRLSSHLAATRLSPGAITLASFLVAISGAALFAVGSYLWTTVLDRYADVAVVAGISLGHWQTHPTAFTLLGAILALTGFILASYTKKEYALRYGSEPPSGQLARLSKRDVRLFVLFAGALLNRPFETMILVGVVSHLAVGMHFLTAGRRERVLGKA